MMELEKYLLKGSESCLDEYRPTTMWFVNDELRREEITSQLESFKEKGILNLFFNPTYGFVDDYLSEHYFDMIRYAVSEAKRLGLYFWIYDEYEFPSGIAGGFLLRDHPELRARVLCDTKLIMPPGYIRRRVYIEGSFICADRVFMEDAERGADDVSDQVAVEPSGDGFYLTCENHTCANVCLHIMSERLQKNVLSAALGARGSISQDGYIDPLREEAIRAFIDCTHEKYKKAVGDEFGKTVKGIFTDEVCVGDPHELGSGKVPWNTRLTEQFREKYGYDMTPWLYALVEKPVTAKEKQVRYHFWRLLTERVRDAHIRQVYDWCEKEGLIYTGHFDGEESLVWSMYQSGDIYDLMPYLHLPGIDSIFSRNKIDDEDFNVAGKILSSCARILGRNRTLCETFTGSSYKLRFEEMRRVVNRLMILGVNMIQLMGSHYSMDNHRKDWKPSFNYQNTLFERADLFGNYLARIQSVSAMTRPAGRVLVINPQSGVYANFDGHAHIFLSSKDRSDFGKYDMFLWGTVNALLELNIEYDMFSDSLAGEVQAKAGHALIGDNAYDTVILQNAGDTTSDVIAMIRRLQKNGVKLIFIHDLPHFAVDTGCEADIFGKEPDGSGVFCVGDNAFYLSEAKENLFRTKNTAFKQKLAEAIGSGYRTLDIRHSGNIYTALRCTEDGKNVVFLANDSGECADAEILWHEGFKLFDPAEENCCKVSQIGNRARIHFDPYQFYILTDSGSDASVSDRLCKTVPIRKAHPECGFAAKDGNILSAKWKYAGSEYTDGSIKIPEDVRLTELDVSGQVPPAASGLCERGILVFDFDAESVPERVKLFAEYGMVLRCELNGARIDEQWTKCRLWGPKDAEIEVSDLIHKGRNRLTMVYTTPDYGTRFFVPFVMLKGDFETDGMNILSKRESYMAEPVNTQGYPQFCGSGSYVFRCKLTEEEAASADWVSVDSLDAAELFVNGVSAGVRLWRPYRFRTEGLFRAGENTLEFRMTLPMHNLFCESGETIDVGLKGAPVLEKSI